MKVGDTVMVYEDPITKAKPEGEATIQYIWHETDEAITATVEFTSDMAEGPFYRTIAKGD